MSSYMDLRGDNDDAMSTASGLSSCSKDDSYRLNANEGKGKKSNDYNYQL